MMDVEYPTADKVCRQLIQHYTESMDELILASLAAGVPITDMTVREPRLMVMNFSARIDGGLSYIRRNQ